MESAGGLLDLEIPEPATATATAGVPVVVVVLVGRRRLREWWKRLRRTGAGAVEVVVDAVGFVEVEVEVMGG